MESAGSASPFDNHAQPARVVFAANSGLQPCGWYALALSSRTGPITVSAIPLPQSDMPFTEGALAAARVDEGARGRRE